MKNGHRAASLLRPLAVPLAAVWTLLAGPAAAQAPSLDELLSAVVKVKTYINADAQTMRNLGREREGSGIVIDHNGLVLTIGYLMVEAYAAEVQTGGRTVPAQVVGYDHETGFGLLRTNEPLKVRPLPFGKAAELEDRDPVLIASFGGAEMAAPAFVVARREFAGSWEYLLDQAIFTAPPHPAWSGAALVNREGKLVGVGSLIVGDALGNNQHFPGNMFVPIDLLPPILADLISEGRVAGPGRPWLGIATDELRGRLFVSRVTPGGPGERAGIQAGDVILGVNGDKPRNLADFYRKVWAIGSAGAEIPLDVLQGTEQRRIGVKSMNRLDHLKLKSTL